VFRDGIILSEEQTLRRIAYKHLVGVHHDRKKGKMGFPIHHTRSAQFHKRESAKKAALMDRAAIVQVQRAGLLLCFDTA